MSDVNKDTESNYTPSYSSVIDQFSRAVARIAIAQICEGVGFRKFQHSALDTLSDVAVRHIREIGRIASLRANLANRSECNVFDVIQGLENLGSIQGFSGSCDVNHSLVESGVVRDVMRYVGEEEEIPFAYLVPRFPIDKGRKLDDSFVRGEENNRPVRYVPSWLPKFPDLETYSELGSEEKKGLGQFCNRQMSEAGIDVKHRDTEMNPYLVPPLRYGEKEVCVPVIPINVSGDATGDHQSCEITENHVSVSESLMLENKTVDRRTMIQNGRPIVHFTFVNGKKSLGMSGSSRIDGFEKSSVWFSDVDGGKDETKRKRKVEQILREKVDCSLLY